MPRKTVPLSSKEIQHAKPKDKDYALFDGNGLYLRIRSSGNRAWIFTYTHPISKKRLNITLGSYPDLSLALARKSAGQARSLIAQDVDPKEYRDQEKHRYLQKTQHTLFNICTSWFQVKKDSITSDYAHDIWRSLELYVFPSLSDYPIDKITAPLVIKILRPIEKKGSLETVKRLSQRLNEVMNYAVNSGLLHANPLISIRHVFKKPKATHFPTIQPQELHQLMTEIANASIRKKTRVLIEFQLHTMTRPAEAAGCLWSEIDLENKVWVISKERMKTRNPHRVPLTEHTIKILNIAKQLCGNSKFVFSSDKDRKKSYNSQTVNSALKRMGFANKLVSHGFRSLASTILNEHSFNRDWIEAALSHTDQNKIRDIYNRTDYLEQRRSMMKWWSQYIHSASQGTLSIIEAKTLSKFD